jgi:hypothetical protein
MDMLIERINNEKDHISFQSFISLISISIFCKVRSIISAIVDAVLDGDRKRRSEVVGNENTHPFNNVIGRNQDYS